jgi:hypothetical protein
VFPLKAAGKRAIDRQRKLRRRLDRKHIAHFGEDGQALQRMKTIRAALADVKKQIDLRRSAL